MTQITKHDALLAIDAAMAALAGARVMVEAIGDDPAAAAPEGCRHLRQTETFTGALCRDCGATLGVPDGPSDTPVSTLRTEENDAEV